jgi:hypothetical protein
MYSVSNERHVSDRNARLLANTPQEARSIQALMADESLKTRFYIRNKIGTDFYSYGDKSQAIKELKRKIRLNSRYVGSEELNNISDNGYIE